MTCGVVKEALKGYKCSMELTNDDHTDTDYSQLKSLFQLDGTTAKCPGSRVQKNILKTETMSWHLALHLYGGIAKVSSLK